MSAYPFNWSELQSAGEMDIGRYFEYDSDAMEMFKRWLPYVDDEVRILEVGAGSGFFTGKLHQLYPNSKITCLEPDPELRQSLSRKFPNIETINIPLEELNDVETVFDIAISHIVIHNLSDPLIAIKQMKKTVRRGGFVICIEPTLGSRHFVSDKIVKEAFDTLWQYKVIVSTKRAEGLSNPERQNPFYNSYPEFFEELGLVNIRCHGWCSVFTLSDSRIDFEIRKMWVRKRKELFEKPQPVRTRILLESGMDSSKVEGAYHDLFKYFDMLENANEQQLAHIHEQEITSRVITIGQRE